LNMPCEFYIKVTLRFIEDLGRQCNERI